MLKLRLMRTGKKKRSCFRLVAEDMRKRRDGKAIEFLGIYHPGDRPAKIEVNEAAVYEWLKKGAVPSDTFRSILKKMHIWEKWALMKAGKDASEIKAEQKPEKERKKKKRKKDKKEAAPAEKSPPAEDKKADQPEAKEKPEKAEPEEKAPAKEEPKGEKKKDDGAAKEKKEVEKEAGEAKDEKKAKDDKADGKEASEEDKKG